MRKYTKFEIGEIVENWTIISNLLYIIYPYAKQKAYKCLCICGTERIKTISALKSGKSKSCGCVRDSLITPLRNTTHGGSKTRLYRIWKAMKRRCLLPTDSTYKSYGGRGITICKEWENDFTNFRTWSLSNNYKDDLTIDRIDGNKGYFPENCRWATYQEQSNNIRTNHILTAFKEQKSIAEWSRDIRCTVTMKGLRARISRGIPSEEAITRPRFSRNNRYKISV